MNRELIYEGKAKSIYKANNDDQVVIYYKDDATAFNGVKKATVTSKGKLNNKISGYIFKELEEKGVETHFIKNISEDEQLCKKVNIIPLEFICRNEVYGSMSKKLNIKQGTILKNPVLEICYKDDNLNDPFINDDYAQALGIATKEELNFMYDRLIKINEILIDIFSKLNIKLIDFKIEFGKDVEGKIILADEISPDSCRLMDNETNEQLDKDLFRHNIGDIAVAYEKIVKRINDNA